MEVHYLCAVCHLYWGLSALFKIAQCLPYGPLVESAFLLDCRPPADRAGSPVSG